MVGKHGVIGSHMYLIKDDNLEAYSLEFVYPLNIYINRILKKFVLHQTKFKSSASYPVTSQRSRTEKCILSGLACAFELACLDK